MGGPRAHTVSWVVAAPAELGYEHLGPGVKVPFAVWRLFLALIAAHETRRDPERSTHRQEHDREIAAGAPAGRKRFGRRLGRALQTRLPIGVGVQIAAQAFEER